MVNNKRKVKFKTLILIGSLVLNLLLSLIVGNFWLSECSDQLGFDSRLDALKSILGVWTLPSVRIEFRIAEDNSIPGLTAVSSPATGNTFYVRNKIELDNNDIESAKLIKTEWGEHVIDLKFTEYGAEKLLHVSSQNIKKRLAILANGRLLVAPIIMDPMKEGRTRIGGGFSKEEAKQIILALSRRNRDVSK